MKQLVLFDFDGVFVPSLETAYGTVKDIQQLPESFTTNDFRRWFDGNVYDALDLEELDGDVSTVPEDEPFFVEYLQRVLRVGPQQGLRDVLERLAQQNRRPHIISSSTSLVIDRWLQFYELRDLVDSIRGADIDISKVRKMQTLLDETAYTAQDAIFVTDTLGDIREANRLSIQSIGVTWGYHESQTLLKGNPLAVVDTTEELAAHLF